VLAFISTAITNAVGEGINRIIKIVKNRASGYRTLEAFTDLIYLTVGDVNLPEQIPALSRTL
jgi:transposase